MSYIFDFNAAAEFEKWFKRTHTLFAAELQKQLMVEFLKPCRNETVLGIGCGTGESLKPFLDKGLQTTVIDPSPYMLDMKRTTLGHRVDFYRGIPEDLPFDDNSFNYTCLIHCLEFTENPTKAIEEACRTAKDMLYIFVLNKYAVKNFYRRTYGIFSSPFFKRAKFFSIWELKRIIRQLLGDVPISWKTVCLLPSATGRISQLIEMSDIIQHCPFGEYTGLAVTLVPRFRTRPIPLKYRAKPAGGVLTHKKPVNTNKLGKDVQQ